MVTFATLSPFPPFFFANVAEALMSAKNSAAVSKEGTSYLSCRNLASHLNETRLKCVSDYWLLKSPKADEVREVA